MTTRRPAAILAHFPGIELFSVEDLGRFEEVATLVDVEPLGSWDDARADRLLARAEVIVGHWGCPRLDADMLARAPRLGLFSYAAGTVKGTVTDAVFERGIRVTSGASANAEPVAEFTLAVILLANKAVFWRRVSRSHSQDPPWHDRGEVPVGNWGKTVGIVGASHVGRRVIELLRSFPQLAVVLYDPYVTAGQAEEMGVVKVGLDELCASVDILSIHAPDLPSTRHMIGAAQLALLRTGATIINTARGGLVDHEALLAEVEDGRLFAVLDVTEPESLPDDSVLSRLPNVFLTPHLAGSEGTELARMVDHAAEEIRRWAHGGPARNEVRAADLDLLA